MTNKSLQLSYQNPQKMLLDKFFLEDILFLGVKILTYCLKDRPNFKNKESLEYG